MRVLQVIIALVLSGSLFAQEITQVPETPSTPSKYNSVTNSSTNSITVTDGETINSSSSSINISDTNKTYKLKSKFNNSKYSEIASKLKKELQGFKFLANGSDLVWTKQKNGKIIFECKLSNKKLHIFSNKKELSSEFNVKIKDLGRALRNFISSNKSFHTLEGGDTNTLSSAQIRLEKAKMENVRRKND